MNYLSASWLIDRRHALPRLGTGTAAVSRMHGPARRPRRRQQLPAQHVHLPREWRPSTLLLITTPGKDYQFSRSLKPLEKHLVFITPISGLHHPGALEPSSQLHQCLVDRRAAWSFGSEHDLVVTRRWRESPRSTHAIPHWKSPSPRIRSLGLLTGFGCLRCGGAARSLPRCLRNPKVARAPAPGVATQRECA